MHKFKIEYSESTDDENKDFWRRQIEIKEKQIDIRGKKKVVLEQVKIPRKFAKIKEPQEKIKFSNQLMHKSLNRIDLSKFKDNQPFFKMQTKHQNFSKIYQ